MDPRHRHVSLTHLICLAAWSSVIGAVPLDTVSPISSPNTSLPSVCIMIPTNSRPEFLEHAMSMISRQDYPGELLREVVIVDDSPTELQRVGRLSRQPRQSMAQIIYMLP